MASVSSMPPGGQPFGASPAPPGVPMPSTGPMTPMPNRPAPGPPPHVSSRHVYPLCPSYK